MTLPRTRDMLGWCIYALDALGDMGRVVNRARKAGRGLTARDVVKVERSQGMLLKAVSHLKDFPRLAKSISSRFYADVEPLLSREDRMGDCLTAIAAMASDLTSWMGAYSMRLEMVSKVDRLASEVFECAACRGGPRGPLDVRVYEFDGADNAATFEMCVRAMFDRTFKAAEATEPTATGAGYVVMVKPTEW